MKWYDYGWCFIFADVIAGSIFSGSILMLTFGIIGYIVYEKVAIMTKDTR